MAKYKVNLDRVWNLPVGIKFFSFNGHYCALGLIVAGVVGEFSQVEFDLAMENLLSPDIMSQESRLNILPNLLNDMFIAGLGPVEGMMFDREIQASPEEEHKFIREKHVRNLLQKGIEAGLFKLEDSDLAIVKELNGIVAKNQEVVPV